MMLAGFGEESISGDNSSQSIHANKRCQDDQPEPDKVETGKQVSLRHSFAPAESPPRTITHAFQMQTTYNTELITLKCLIVLHVSPSFSHSAQQLKPYDSYFARKNIVHNCLWQSCCVV